ncbi:MAG: DUF1320 domain-containing protein [Candidatus Pacearchaeota archaeon]
MYCTKEDVYSQMDQRVVAGYLRNTGETGNEWETRLNDIITKATDEINGYLRGRYSLPLNHVPGFIRDLCVRIVKYKIVSRKGYTSNSPEEGIAKDYQGVVKILEKIRDGDVDIGISTNEAESVPSPKAIYSTKKKYFGDNEFWRGF